MKKAVLFLSVFVVACFFGATAVTKTTIVQEYEWDPNGLGGVVKKTDQTPVETCPSDYPYTPYDLATQACGSGKVDGNPKKINDGKTACYRCKEQPKTDCGDLDPDPNDSSKCLCPEGYYKKDQLTEGKASSSVFTFNSIKSPDKSVTCYKPSGCQKGIPVTKDAFTFNDDKAYSKNTKICAYLKVKSALKDSNAVGNVWCATGYGCSTPCTRGGEDKKTCAQDFETENSLSNYLGSATDCKYYPGCKSGQQEDENYCLANTTNLPDYFVAEKASEITIKEGNKKTCYKLAGCQQTNTEYMYGETVTVTGKENAFVSDRDTFGNRTCYRYSCNTNGGWEKHGVVTSQSIDVEKISPNGKYEVAYATATAGSGVTYTYICKKPVSVPQKSDSGCPVCEEGEYFDTKTNTCSTEETKYVYISDQDGNAKLLDLTQVGNYQCKDYSEAAGLLEFDDLINYEDLKKISGTVLKKYAGKCLATKGGIKRLEQNGTFTTITKDNFSLCYQDSPSLSSIIPLGDTMLAWTAKIFSFDIFATAKAAEISKSNDNGSAIYGKEHCYDSDANGCLACLGGFRLEKGGCYPVTELEVCVFYPADASYDDGQKCPQYFYKDFSCTRASQEKGGGVCLFPCMDRCIDCESSTVCNNCETGYEQTNIGSGRVVCMPPSSPTGTNDTITELGCNNPKPAHCDTWSEVECKCTACENGYNLTENGCEKHKPEAPIIPLKVKVHSCSTPVSDEPSDSDIGCPVCEVGDYFDTENKTCLKEMPSNSIKNIYLGQRGENEIEVLVYPVQPDKIQEKIDYTAALAKKSSSILTKAEFNSIKDKILEVYGANCYILKDGIIKLGADRTVVSLDNEESYKKECSKENIIKVNINDFSRGASLIQKIMPLGETKLAYQSSISILDSLGYAFMSADGSIDITGEQNLTCEPSNIEGCLETSLNDEKSCQICAGGYTRESYKGKMICLKCQYVETSGVGFNSEGESPNKEGDGCYYPDRVGNVTNPCQMRSSKLVTMASSGEVGCYVKSEGTKEYKGYPCMTGCKKCSNATTCEQCSAGYSLKNGRCTKYECSNREEEFNKQKGLGCVCDAGRKKDENGCCIEGSSERTVILFKNRKRIFCH